MGDRNTKLTTQEKAIALFQFLEEMNKLRQKTTILNISKYDWHRSIESFPDDPENITINYRDRVEDEKAEGDSSVLVSVHKPTLRNCPAPNASFERWLKNGWDDCKCEASVFETLESKQTRSSAHNQASREQKPEKFTDNKDRVRDFKLWKKKRDEWAKKQAVLLQTRDLFAELFDICIELERDSTTQELVVADGFVRDRKNPEIDHPVVIRRVKIKHLAAENTIVIEDVDVETVLYTLLFQNMMDINLTSINKFRDDLQANDYHPLDRNDLPLFLKSLINKLSSDSKFMDSPLRGADLPKERLVLYRRPTYFLRKREDGALKALEQIRSHITLTEEVPAPIADIIEGGKIEVPDLVKDSTVEEQLAAVGGESAEIFLSKEANREQLEIAKRIEKYNAVLVQGPPGTGKTHTIANLLGHFLAQGKSVLVTSHTQKALRVLKDKVAPGLQSLCVSVLEDSNVDMERSIDGITSYMGSSTSSEVKRKMERLGLQRAEIIKNLAKVRKKIFTIINQEYSSIVYNGESLSPSEMARFVQENSETLSYIPGKVRVYEPMPLSYEELSELYRSNVLLSAHDESEFEHDLPDPKELMSPEHFQQQCQMHDDLNSRLKEIAQNKQWKIKNYEAKKKVAVSGPFGKLELTYPSKQDNENLRQHISRFQGIDPWMQQCAADGKRNQSYRELWLTLIAQIEKTCACSETLAVEKFGKKVEIKNSDQNFVLAMNQLCSKFRQKGKIGKIDLMLNKKLSLALNGAAVNGLPAQSADDCQLVLHFLETEAEREKCSLYWNDLMTKHGQPEFKDLDSETPEQIAKNYIPYIHNSLDWFKNDYQKLTELMKAVNLPCEAVFQEDISDSDLVSTKKILEALDHDIPAFCDIFDIVLTLEGVNNDLNHGQNPLKTGKRAASVECRTLLRCMESQNTAGYKEAYDTLVSIYGKMSHKVRREQLLQRLNAAAPQWSDQIRNRVGIHGEEYVPADIEDAWRWKQYYEIIDELLKEPFPELQKKSLNLSKKYREVTADYAEKSAWYHLLKTTECDITLKQALQGWKQTVKRIGKGTGKSAPKNRAKARELMAKCQKAVPVWIMPVTKALESLNPSVNKFDVVIIDEASQSDLSSLAVLYMGKKLIIVGDDKQVSPMAIGVDMDKSNALKEMYLEGKIPNAHLYDGKTSVYDIAATTFQPLMLHEHFRCVPEIISFSNSLSYDFKIKPLRDCSGSRLQPAVVNYRVEDGKSTRKRNPNEAKAIVALLKACISQPEYANKTFGIISLLGDEQVKVLQTEVNRMIDSVEYNKHKILCGNSSNFQGDERDVIFLSVVDSAEGDGPLALRGFGPDDSYRKRYNVAASRAKDQLWVVDSLDPALDLKPGDIRKKLIDFSLNPRSVLIQEEMIEKKSESPFEAAVAKYLTNRGYHLVQQWEVGAYRLDMVAIYKEKKIAIECDGERFHSGEDKIREDMERQTILERLGWQFIRIRGSEFYRDRTKTMERVMEELSNAGIEPENIRSLQSKSRKDTELLSRVKKKAREILKSEAKQETDKQDTIAAALNPRTMSSRGRRSI